MSDLKIAATKPKPKKVVKGPRPFARRLAAGVAVLIIGAAVLVLWLMREDAASPEALDQHEPAASSPLPSASKHAGDEPSPSAASTAQARVEGSVVDEEGAPIPGAELTFHQEGRVSTARADADGRFIVITQPGAATLARVSFPGFLAFEPAEGEYRLHALAGEAVEGLEVVLRRVRTVKGRVILEGGAPVEGASLSSLDLERPVGLSGAQGEFEVELPTGAQNLLVNHRCCSLAVSSVPAEGKWIIELQPVAAAAEVTHFSGTVVDEEGHPVSGATVQLSGGSEALLFRSSDSVLERLATLTTDADGGFSADLAVRTVRALASLGTSRSEVGMYRVSRPARLQLLRRASALSGRVTEAQGEPLRSFEVRVFRPGFETSVTVFSSDGTYRVTDLPRGALSVAVTASGCIDSAPREVTLEAGSPATGIDFSLARGGELSGLVFDEETREPLAGVAVTAPGRAAETDVDGRFVLEGLAAGRVQLSLKRAGYVERELQATAPSTVSLGLRGASPVLQHEYEGVGLELDAERPLDGHGYRVRRLHVEGGARVAGVVVGDEVLAVEGIAAGSVPFPAFSTAFKGPQGTLVKLTLARGGKQLDVVVVRRRLQWSVTIPARARQ